MVLAYIFGVAAGLVALLARRRGFRAQDRYGCFAVSLMLFVLSTLFAVVLGQGWQHWVLVAVNLGAMTRVALSTRVWSARMDLQRDIRPANLPFSDTPHDYTHYKYRPPTSVEPICVHRR